VSLEDLPDNPSAQFLRLAVKRGLIPADRAFTLYADAAGKRIPVDALMIELGILTDHSADTLREILVEPDKAKVIAGFRILRRLGEGATATVYRALQLSMDREVALKVMSTSFARHKTARERFLREAQAAAQINHPNVVGVHDIGEDRRRLYIAMELVEGGDTRSYAERSGGRLPDKKVLQIFHDCTKGLVAINAVGLLHRDIKPSNIFVDRDGRAKLADLGMARPEQEGDDRLTMTGALVGTPSYMSPEQARAETLDTRADIYSLGASMFELALGDPPFDGPNAFAVITKVLNEDPPDPLELRPEMSRGLARIIRKCIARDPEDRYRDAQELHDAVFTVLSAHTSVFERPMGQSAKRKAISASSRRHGPASTSRRRQRHEEEVALREEERRRSKAWGLLYVVILLGIVALLYAYRDVLIPEGEPVAEGDGEEIGKELEDDGTELPPIPEFTDLEDLPVWSTGGDERGRYADFVHDGSIYRFRWIPPGTFTMGSQAREIGRQAIEVRHEVELSSGFWLLEHEVTQKLWLSVMPRNPSRFPSPSGLLPVERVSWHDVQHFLHALESAHPGLVLRLPTEAEWEYAARAGEDVPFTHPEQVEAEGWHEANVKYEIGGSRPRRVKGKNPNSWGLYDMLGNVSEWTADSYVDFPPDMDRVVDPAHREGEVRVYKGGSWDDPVIRLRAAMRAQGDPTGTSSQIGFRFVVVSPPKVEEVTSGDEGTGNQVGTGRGGEGEGEEPSAPAD